MKLSADVIYDNLPASFGARLLGTPHKGLTLRRPELLESGMHAFKDDHLYVVREERLPQRVSVGSRAVIVCIGPGRRTRYFAERCCVIQVPNADFYSVFNTVQRIFDRHDAWEMVLNEIINGDANIDSMLECSGQIFENPLTVIDSEFRYLGQWDRDMATDQGTLAALDASSILDPDDFASFISNHELSMDVAEPFVIELLDTKTLNANLLDSGTYLGCLTVYGERRDFRPSDTQLASYLATLLVRAIRRRSMLPGSDGTSMRRILIDLVDEIPLDGRERAMLDVHGRERTFVCVRIRLDHRLSQLPIGYVCTMVESVFPKSIAFEHHRTSVVAFIDIDQLGEHGRDYRDEIIDGLGPFVSTLDAKAAVSDPMDDASRARLYFLQASTTLENGTLIDPDRNVYLFQDYALVGMIINALGDMPIDMLFSEGLRRLQEHDERSQTSYLETLACLIDNNMSVTKTARALYVHRSTLLERLARIRRELGEDLDDPDVRLRIQIVLKALVVRKGFGEA